MLSCIAESSGLRWNMCLWFKPHQLEHQKKTSNQHSLEMCPFLKGSTWGQVKRYHFHSNSRLDWVSFDWIIGPLAAKRKEESEGERKGLGERRGQALNLPRGLALSATQTIRILSLTEGVVFLSSLSLSPSLSAWGDCVTRSVIVGDCVESSCLFVPDTRSANKAALEMGIKAKGHSWVWPEGRIPNPEAQSSLASNKGRDLCECKNTSTFEKKYLGGSEYIYISTLGKRSFFANMHFFLY